MTRLGFTRAVLRGEEGRLLAAALLGALALASAAALTATGGALISRAAQRPDTLFTLTFLITGVRALGLGRAALRYVERLLAHDFTFRTLARARTRVYAALVPRGRRLGVQVGAVTHTAHADVDALQNATLRAALPLLAYLLLTAALALAVARLSVPLALGVLGLLLLAGVLAPLAACAPLARLARERAHARAALTAALTDTLHASAETATPQDFSALERTLERADARDNALLAVLTFARESAAAAALLLTLVTVGGAVLSGALPGAWLAAAALGVVTAFDAAAPLAGVPGALADAAGADGRLHALTTAPIGTAAPPRPTRVPDRPDLHLDGVRVRHGDQLVVQDFSLHVPHGRAVALVGPSGAGKTTLARLLVRDLDPDAGAVRWGGVDARHLDPHELHARAALMEQDAPLLSGTLRANLRLADRALPDERLRALLNDLGLAHFDLDGWVGEGGARLSGGERARVALARALLKPSDVLILDEPTAHLDPPAEALALRVIERERQGRTLIIITHRPGPLALVDDVLPVGVLPAGGTSPPAPAPTAPSPAALALTPEAPHGRP
ncbi:thiol reductant ABC exporter subunit CydC [Deinococcus maricopensis]|uniref:ABC transporter, CydDC cysteine exporter (CydDC-E) family, permease/ATP-binding protein CydC n=1 Tax=Deinococcus maricopensis (strain DSM 21211 / LMG 22137 / NRRL B-23946 / LB-34) TaxID=709986 RepID=E8U7D9_DEIML|nr:thiol reductant ABC exporter subunit CydC [Deinococcus maricopensis]ADV66978.1 ABC transporter, CydDC cysteine exporter (CydDC-E) family, permease/ATP-binding protein CydC [Deinococcus maricopensis DSM 21211]